MLNSILKLRFIFRYDIRCYNKIYFNKLLVHYTSNAYCALLYSI